MDFQPSQKSQEYLARLNLFMQAHVYPIEREILQKNHDINGHGSWQEWQTFDEIQALKLLAKQAGLWNLFLPDEKLGQGLTTLEYAPLAEAMGQVPFASEIFNCNAPDTGNMEVLYHFGSDDQKETWLKPLLNGEIRSVFAMTEPQTACSDATNIEASIAEDGDELVINGHKWWTTGLGHPDAKVAIFMGKSDFAADRHRQHSMVIVPLDSAGVSIKRMLTACNDYDAPYGHGEVVFDNVRVPKANLIGGLGDGFAIAQGRLGPGRIHHCMRCIGAAERSLDLAVQRSISREAFGRPLAKLGGNSERIADARIAIDQARLLTMFSAWKIDQVGVKHAMTEISAIKVVAPNVLQDVSDMAIQLFGGMGVSGDTPLMHFYTQARCLRLADGPDEVHRAMISRLELNKQGKR